MTALQEIFTKFREHSETELEKGKYFEKLMITYFLHASTYKDNYSKVWLYGEWAEDPELNVGGLSKDDTGIDLVAKERGTDEYHPIQCKFYKEEHTIYMDDLRGIGVAGAQKPFAHRIFVTTTDKWSDKAYRNVRNQKDPVTLINSSDLESSGIDWSKYKSDDPDAAPVLKDKKKLLDHQRDAIKAVEEGFKKADRGKLIMACGTGKTLTTLKIAEDMAGSGKRVLFLVPSLTLLSQTLSEWKQESNIPINSFAVCSDRTTGKKKIKNQVNEDAVELYHHELSYPATTDAKKLSEQFFKRHDNQHMSVIFATYHSIDVITKAQSKTQGDYQLPEFDLVICDEAHRTTGATFEGEDESNFVRIHENKYIKAEKRLYMTATPRIYSPAAEAKAEQDKVDLYSMNNEKWYGKELYVLTFSKAVEEELLADYKVIVLTVEKNAISERLQNLLSDGGNELRVDDAAKIIGCWKALSKQNQKEFLTDDRQPMRRAVAFCQVINNKTKVSSMHIADMFQKVVEAYQEGVKDYPADDHVNNNLICQAKHVDGSMNAVSKKEKIDWLKAESAENTCRILSNVRCLSEGVDVPALDAVLFLTPRNSQIDVVQSVGRVMRRIPGSTKKWGYVILPVVIPSGVNAETALNDNETYKVVWQVLQALRSHDDSFDSTINKMSLNGLAHSKMEIISITDTINKKADSTKNIIGKGNTLGVSETSNQELQKQVQIELDFKQDSLERALCVRTLKECGNRKYWEDWADDIAEIAKVHTTRIRTIIKEKSNSKEIAAFKGFAGELRNDLNGSISDDEVIEMLAQHLITKPVFDALFEDYSFASNNPVSKAMQGVVDTLQEHHLEKETGSLEGFYASVKKRASGINNAEGKQKIIVELYDKFFSKAFPRMTERLGIVYTPVEIVDFIIHSINDLLQKEFKQTLGSEGVHIVDPFIGTGTFITRLLQSGLISKEQLAHKYKKEIHCNEIVLLAYYIAAINIEAVYHAVINEGEGDREESGEGSKKHDYEPFEGICLTDTFQLYEKKGDVVSDLYLLVDNSARSKRQKALDIRVIMGNPPYSIGQKNENDNNKNVKYESLDNSIAKTYASRSEAINKKGLYDSYIRAIRWASDRVGDSGIIGFVTNAGFIDASSTDGLRKCLVDEFSSIYIFHLRGDQRTSGELSLKEAGKIFGGGSRAPIAISLLVKNPAAKKRGQIYFHNIGDYLSREEKLEKIKNFNSVDGIEEIDGWQRIIPNRHGDWLNQRDDSFNEYIVLGDKKSDNLKLFDNYSLGIVTNRDAWCYNFSRAKLSLNMEDMIGFYNLELNRFNEEDEGSSTKRKGKVNDFIDNNPTKISWTRALKGDLAKNKGLAFNTECLTQSLYRPFIKQYLYFNRSLNEMVYQMPRIFPEGDKIENIVIMVIGTGAKNDFSCFISNLIPDLNSMEAGAQCFPLYLYEKNEDDSTETGGNGKMFAEKKAAGTGESGYTRKDGISDEGLDHFKRAYPDGDISKEDIFYYIYGLLHSPAYRKRYANNLLKEISRIPCVKKEQDFWAFSKAGGDLADLHINYETVDKYKVTFDCGKRTIKDMKNDDFRVKKMKHPKIKADGKSVSDKSAIIYNTHITLKNIPLEAYDYVVNVKAALEWVMDRQSIRTDEKSGKGSFIVNDANDWATDTMNNPKYPLELLQRVITVSLETNKIVNGLPALDID